MEKLKLENAERYLWQVQPVHEQFHELLKGAGMEGLALTVAAQPVTTVTGAGKCSGFDSPEIILLPNH